MRETWVQSLDWEDPLEKGKATHSSTVARRIPWTIKSTGSQRVRHDWASFTFTLLLNCSNWVFDLTLVIKQHIWEHHSMWHGWLPPPFWKFFSTWLLGHHTILVFLLPHCHWPCLLSLYSTFLSLIAYTLKLSIPLPSVGFLFVWLVGWLAFYQELSL